MEASFYRYTHGGGRYTIRPHGPNKEHVEIEIENAMVPTKGFYYTLITTDGSYDVSVISVDDESMEALFLAWQALKQERELRNKEN